MSKTAAKVGLDLSFLTGPRTGVGTYAAALCAALVEAAVPEFELFAWTGVRNEPLGQWIGAIGKEPGPQGAPSWRLRTVLRRAGPLYRVAWHARNWLAPRSDLFHALNFTPTHRVSGIVIPTVHDLTFMRHPECCPPDRIEWLNGAAALIRRAPVVHTVSEFSKSELVELLGVAPERIHVIPPAAEPELRTAGRTRNLPFGLRPQQFILSLGTLEPRKNLRTLIAAFLALTPAERRECPLVVVGPSGWGDLRFPDAAHAAAEKGEIRFAGYLPRADVRSLLATARVLAYPSIYEGFGMPVLEATYAGTPTIISRTPALREAGCGLAREVDALDVDAWTEALRDAVAERPPAELGERLSQAAAARYSWRKSAEKTIELYRHARDAAA